MRQKKICFIWGWEAVAAQSVEDWAEKWRVSGQGPVHGRCQDTSRAMPSYPWARFQTPNDHIGNWNELATHPVVAPALCSWVRLHLHWPQKGSKKTFWGSFWMEMCCASIRLRNFLVCSFVFLVTVMTKTMSGVKFVWYLVLVWSHYKGDIDHITPDHCMQWARAENSDRPDFTCCGCEPT